MQKYKISFFMLFLMSISYGQQFQEYSVHKAQRDEFGSIEKKLSKFPMDGSGIIPLQINEQKELSKIVFGYMPDWEYNSGAHANQHYNLLTHIATFDFPVSSSGAVGFPSSWPWTDVINAAHSVGTKVIMTAVSFDEDDIRKIITDETSKQKFFSNTKNIIQTYQLDGVNVDFEGLYSADKGSRINDFMTELTTFIHAELPGKEVSFAGPAVNWGGYWDLDGLVQSCDYVFIMGYSFWGSWSSSSGPNAPLIGFTHDITSVVTVDYGTPVSKYPEKIILGVPYYGHTWKTISGNSYTSVDTANGGFQGSTRFYNDVENADIYGLIWDNKSETSWFRWQEGTQWFQTWFDDVQSLDKKYDLALAQSLGGVGMWALGYDGDKQDLWNLIDYKFGSASLPIPNKPKGLRVLQHDGNTLILGFEMVDFADKYGIYMSRNGLNFEKITESTSNSVSITNLETDSIYYFKIDAINASGTSSATEVLAGIPSESNIKILIVNGFDRISNTTNTFNYIRMYDKPMKNLDLTFSSTSNEAIYKGAVSLSDYRIVIWMLMDESTVNETFNSLEQEKVMAFLDDGGVLILSGSEVGWDLDYKGSAADKEFYNNYLKAKYISDAPNNEQGVYYTTYNINMSESNFNFDDGTHGTINVDWPDVVEAFGTVAVNRYAFKDFSTSKGFAGIQYLNVNGGAVEYLTFPIESVYDVDERTQLLKELIEPHIIRPSVNEDGLTPAEFVLCQNYPNPFNPSTTIKYSIPSNVSQQTDKSSSVKLTVYDILGREVATLVDEFQQAGNYEVKFNASSVNRQLTSGTYFYRIRVGEFSDSKKMILLK